MFYKCKNKKRRTIILVVITVLLIIWGGFVIRVARAFPSKTIVRCEQNEWIDYSPEIKDFISADVSISPVSCNIISGGEIAELYPETYMRGSIPEDKKFLVFDIAVRNNADESLGIRRLVGYFLYCSPFNGDCNSLTYIDENNVNEIEGGEEKVIKLAARLHYEDALPDSYSRYIKEEVYMLISQYPIEKRLVFRIENGDEYE